MTHLPYVGGGLCRWVWLIPGGFALMAFLRMRAAQRRLAAIGPRAAR